MDKYKARIKKKIIVVLGMHRSGTSAITRGLMTMGVDLGDNLMPPVPENNEKGFWEDLDINALNIEMLEFLKKDWHFMASMKASDFKVLHENGYVTRALDLVKEKTSVSKVFGLKDPRITKLLPFWKGVFAQSQLDVHYVISLRHPLSVCQSLAKRDGFDIEKGAFLWLGHVLNSLSETMRESRIIIDYDRLMQCPDEEISRIAHAFNLVVDSDELIIFKEDFLDLNLQHTIYELNDLVLDEAIPPLAHDVYGSLLQIAGNDQSLDLPSFESQILSWKTKFEQQNLALALVDKLSAAIAERDAQLAERDAQLAERDAQLAERDAQLAERDAQLAERDAQLAERNAELEALYNSNSWKITKPLRFLIDLVR